MTVGMVVACCLGFIVLVTFILEYRMYKSRKTIEELREIMQSVMLDSDNVRSNAMGLLSDYNIVVNILYEEIGSERADREFIIRKEMSKQSDILRQTEKDS